MELHLRKRKAGYERGSTRERYIHKKMPLCKNNLNTIPIQNYTSCLQQHWETCFHHTLALDWWTSYLRVGVSANGVGLLFFPWSPPGIFVFVLEGKRLHSWSLRTKKEPTMQVMPVLQLTSHGLHSAVLGMSKILLLKCQADILVKINK